MMVRIDLGAAGGMAARALRVRGKPAPGVALVAEAGPRLPFRDESIDEVFVGRAISHRADIAETLDELWRLSRPGALIHLTLPHASSMLAVTRDPRAGPLLTLNTFNYYDPRLKPPDVPTPATFSIERARLRVAGLRGDDSGLALARGPFARFIEKLANGSRGSQYRFERWFAGLIGGFEEFDVVLSAVKREEPAQAGSSTIEVTSDVAHEAAAVEDAPDEVPAAVRRARRARPAAGA